MNIWLLYNAQILTGFNLVLVKYIWYRLGNALHITGLCVRNLSFIGGFSSQVANDGVSRRLNVHKVLL